MLISKSKSATEPSVREEYLREAMILDKGGETAPRALADYYVSLGRYDKAWRVLNSWPLTPNNLLLGEYALRAQDYTPAQRFYARAIKQKATAQAYTGLATALFNKGDNANGCANAAKALKLELASEPAQNVAAICALLSPNQTLVSAGSLPVLQSPQLSTARGVGIFLIANRVYSVGEKRLLAAPPKTAGDWLMLAQLAQARGDYKLAAGRGEKGIALDRANPSLNLLLAQTYKNLGNTAKAAEYSARFEAIPVDR